MSFVINKLERPYRTPKSVEHMVAEPDFARAGTIGRWKFPFLLARDVPPNHSLFLQIHGKRSNLLSWPGLQAQDKNAEGYVSLVTDSYGPLKSIQVLGDDGMFEFEMPPDGLAEGERITVDIGGQAGTAAPVIAISSKFFLLLDIPPGEKPQTPVLIGEAVDRVVAACQIVIAGGDAERLAAYAPSAVAVGEEFSVLFRPEDRWGNVASTMPGQVAVRVDGREVGARVEPVDGSSCRWLKGIVLSKSGAYRIEVEDQPHGLKTLTNPIVCTDKQPEMRLLWGMIHGHTEMSDGFGTLEHYFNYMRAECGLDFGATGDHDHLYETSDEMWAESQEAVARHNKPGRFTTFLGYEWAKWRRNGDGDRNVYFLNDRRPMYRSDEGHSPFPNDLFASLKDEQAIVIPHHPANPRNFCDWKDHDPLKERLVEIYSVWGNSERGETDGNPFPIRASHEDNPEMGEYPPGFVQRALEMGWRIGFTAGGDDHRGHPGDNINPEAHMGRCRAGLFAVCAKENTRESIWDALWNRRCVATTGARIAVDFRLDGQPMGSELSASDLPDISLRRRVVISVHGTDKLASVEIVRNNKDVHIVTPNSLDVELDWVDETPLDQIYLPPALYSSTPFVFYYVRVTQADGEMAWASPIWIAP